MNEHLTIGPHGLRLLTEYEKGPDDGTVPLSSGGAALAPYVCPGGELTIGYGCTKWFDGEDVEIHHRLRDDAEALELLDYQLDPYEAAVKRLAKRPLTQNQYAAFVALCYNIGEANFATSEALREFNEGRMENAAAAFGNWTGATCERPPKRWPRGSNPADYEAKIIKDHKGSLRWKGPNGQYCRYMLRYVGLLSRHYAEALLFMNRNWTRTLSENGVKLFLTPTHPDNARWNPVKGRWEDNVKDKTMFKDVLAFAYFDDLPSPEPVLLPDRIERVEAPSASLPEVLPGPSFEGIPTQLPLPSPVEDEDELFLEVEAAAAEEISGAKGAAPSPATQPEVARAPSQPDSNPAASPAGSRPAPATVAPQSPAGAGASPVGVPAPPKPPPVIAPKSIDIKAIPYGEIDPVNPPATNMSDSRRVLGMVIVGAGSLVQILAAREIVSSSVGAIFFDMSRDPVVVALIAGGAMWLVGWLTRKRGTQIVTKGMVEAKSVLK